MSQAADQHSAAASESVNAPMPALARGDCAAPGGDPPGSPRSWRETFSPRPPSARADQGAQRMIIEADLGVGEVLVVDQDQVGAWLAGQFRHHRARARYV